MAIPCALGESAKFSPKKFELTGMSYATFKNKKLEALIEGRPQVIIHNGRVFEEVMRNAKLTHHELNAALRRSGCTCAEEVQIAVLENNGSISIVTRAASGA